METLCGTENVYGPAIDLWKALQKKMEVLHGTGGKNTDLKKASQREFKPLTVVPTTGWEYVVNAARHEMTDQIANSVESVISEIGHLPVLSEDTLISSINNKGNRVLTLSETQYLQSLIQRVPLALNQPETVHDDHSYIPSPFVCP